MADTKTLAAFAWSGHCVYGSRASIDAVIALLKTADEIERLRGNPMTDNVAKNATPRTELEKQIMDPNIPKNEREWWAADEIERLRAALEIIAGRRQCLDNLMGNVDVACAALDGGKP